MFDVGFAELFLLFIIGLLVLGPERLPRVARTLGGLTRKARSSWLNLKRSIEAEIRAEELKQPLEKIQKDMRSAVDGVNRQVDEFHREVTGPVTPARSGSGAPPAPASSTGSPTVDDDSKGTPVTRSRSDEPD